MTAAVLLAGTHAGVGKTTIAAGLAAALRATGLHVELFRIGCDVEDLQASSQDSPPAINLSGWLLDREQLLACYHTYAASADLAIVEGCCGLFDAASSDGSEQGSTAQVAKWLRAPVVLVVDCAANSTARGIAVLLRGYSSFDSELGVAGVLLNRVTGPSQVAELQEGLRALGCTIPVLGGVPKVDDGWSTPGPDWHSSASANSASATSVLADPVLRARLVAEGADLEALQALAATAGTPLPGPQSCSPCSTAAPKSFRAALGVARDEAFCRYYQHNLTLLTAAGVQLVPFSPLRDGRLPPGLSGVYLGGGPVVRWAHHLAANSAMLAALRAFAAAGGLVWAEGSGLMYASQSLDAGLQHHALAGLLPFRTRALPRATTPACISIAVQPGCPLLPEGATLRGCAYHTCEVVTERVLSGLGPLRGSSSSGGSSSDMAALELQQGGSSCTSEALSSRDSSEGCGDSGFQHTFMASCQGVAACVAEGYAKGSTLATAVHVHLGSCPAAVQHILQRCLRVDVAATTSAASAAAAAAAAEAEAAAFATGAAGSHPVDIAAAGDGGRRSTSRSLGAKSLPDLSVAVADHSSSSSLNGGGMCYELDSPTHSSWQQHSSGFGRQAEVARCTSIPANLHSMAGPGRGNGTHAVTAAAAAQQQQQGRNFAVPARFSVDLARYSSVLAPGTATAGCNGAGDGAAAGGEATGTARGRGARGDHSSSGCGRRAGSKPPSISGAGMPIDDSSDSLPDPLADLLQHALPPLGATTHSKGIGLACPLQVGSQPAGSQQQGQLQQAAPGLQAQVNDGQVHGAASSAGLPPLSQGHPGAAPAAATSVFQQMSGLLLQQQQQQHAAPASKLTGMQQQQQTQLAPGKAVAGLEAPPQGVVHPQDVGRDPSCSSAGSSTLPQQANGHRRTWSLDYGSTSSTPSTVPGGLHKLPAAAGTDSSSGSNSRQLLSRPASTSPGWRPQGSGSQGGAAADARVVPGGPIVSLCPAATDVLLQLGLGSRLAGVTEEDLAAASALSSASRVGPSTHGSAAEAAAASSKAAVLEGAALVARTVPGSSSADSPAAVAWQVDEEALRCLHPQLILAPGEQQPQGASSTAAAPVTPAGGRPAFTAALARKALKRMGALWPESGVTVLFQQCTTLADVVDFMRVVAEAAGAPQAAEAAVQELQQRLRAVAAAVRAAPAPPRPLGFSRSSVGGPMQQQQQQRAPRVLVVSSITPLQVAGCWVPELLQLVCGHGPQPEWLPEAGEPSAAVPWSQLRGWGPEVLVLALPHCSAGAAALQTAALASQPSWWGLPAVVAGAVYAVDEALLCRPGPGLQTGAELLGHLVAPHKVVLPAAAAGMVLRFSLHSGQRCRARLVPNYFTPLM